MAILLPLHGSISAAWLTLVLVAVMGLPSLIEWVVRAWRIAHVRRLIAAGLLALVLVLIPLVAQAAILKADCDPWFLEWFWICV